MNIIKKLTGRRASEAETLSALVPLVLPSTLPPSVATLDKAYALRDELSQHEQWCFPGSAAFVALKQRRQVLDDVIRRHRLADMLLRADRLADEIPALVARHAECEREAEKLAREHVHASERVQALQGREAELLREIEAIDAESAQRLQQTIQGAQQRLQEAIEAGDQAAEKAAAESLVRAEASARPDDRLPGLRVRLDALQVPVRKAQEAEQAAAAALRLAKEQGLRAELDLVAARSDAATAVSQRALFDVLRTLARGKEAGIELPIRSGVNPSFWCAQPLRVFGGEAGWGGQQANDAYVHAGNIARAGLDLAELVAVVNQPLKGLELLADDALNRMADDRATEETSGPEVPTV